MSERIRQAIQAMLDAEGDGYIVEDFVLALGLQKMLPDGSVDSTAWVWTPTEQADWKTDGLLRAAVELRADQDIDTD